MSSSHIKLSDWFYGSLKTIPEPSIYWKCNEASGNLIDTQKLVDVPIIGTVYGNGEYRGTFSSSNRFLYTGDDADTVFDLTNDAEFIISFKLKASATNDIIVEKGSLNFTTVTKLINNTYYDTVQFQIGTFSVYGNSDIQDGEEHYIQVVSLNNYVRLYVDGLNQMEAEDTISSTADGDISIGAGSAGANELDGYIGDIYIARGHSLENWEDIEAILTYLRLR